MNKRAAKLSELNELVPQWVRDFWAPVNLSSRTHYVKLLSYVAEVDRSPLLSPSQAAGRLLMWSSSEGPRKVAALRHLLSDRGLRESGIIFWTRLLGRMGRYAYRHKLSRWNPPLRRSPSKYLAMWDKVTPTYAVQLRKWLDGLAALGYTSSTRFNYQSSALLFGSYLRSRSLAIRHIRPEHIVQWIRWQYRRGLVPSTIQMRVTVLRTYFTWLHGQGEVPENPMSAIRRIKVPPRQGRAVSEETMVTLLKSVRGPRERALLEVLYASGCRAAEAASMNVADINFKDRTIRCMGKGQRERLLFLNGPATKALKRYLGHRQKRLEYLGSPHERALFIARTGRRLQPHVVSVLVRQVAARACVRVTAHVIRHSFATHLLNRGADFDAIKRLLGHQSLVSTSLYARLVPDRVRHVYDKFCPRSVLKVAPLRTAR